MNRLHRFDILTAWYGEYLTIQSYRPRTIKDYLFELSFFRRFVEKESDKQDIDEFDNELLKNYTASLYNRNCVPHTIHHKIAALRSFFKALYGERKLYVDLSEHLIMPRIGKKLPSGVLTEAETQQLFKYLENRTESKPVHTFEDALAVRDRALIEVLYSTGVRRNELLNIRLTDVNYSDGLITIIEGKGGKDRVVPVGGTALFAVDTYVREARPRLSGACPTDYLFVNRWGKQLGAQGLSDIVNNVITKSGLQKHIRVHDMRHTCATHMLNHGADIRYVQELLGHASLSSTQIYTHVSINKLKETHDKYHPRENG